MSAFQIKRKETKVDECYGLYEMEISIKDIAALLSGKKLYSTVSMGEYAITITLEEPNGGD